MSFFTNEELDLHNNFISLTELRSDVIPFHCFQQATCITFLYNIARMIAKMNNIPPRISNCLLSLANPLRHSEEFFKIIISKANDLIVWNYISELLLHNKYNEAEKTLPAQIEGPSTPPPHHSTGEPEVSTPIRCDSGSNSTFHNQTHGYQKALIALELKGSVAKGVQGFHERFYEPHYADGDIDDWKEVCKSKTEIWLTKGPADFERSSLTFFQWISDKVKSTKRCFYGCGRPLHGARHGAARICDIVLVKRLEGDEHTDAIDGKKNHDWRDVLVLGEFKSNANEDFSQDILLQLASYVRKVYGAQPGRRFVHAFTICGNILRFYLFDRAGVSISPSTDISLENNQLALLKAMRAYLAMTPSQLGFDERYKNEIGDPFLPSSTKEIPEYLYLKSGDQNMPLRFKIIRVLYAALSLVSRGTVCYLAVDLQANTECVIKSSWRSTERVPEAKFYMAAIKSGVLGFSEIVYTSDDKVEMKASSNPEENPNIRQGLTKPNSFPDTLSGDNAGETTHSARSKGKRSGEHKDNKGSKKSKPNPTSSRTHTILTSGMLGRELLERAGPMNGVSHTAFENALYVIETLEALSDAIKCMLFSFLFHSSALPIFNSN